MAPKLNFDHNLSEFNIQSNSPEESYIHLEINYYINLVTGPSIISSSFAGGVCVSSDSEGCFVVTVNHFCEIRHAGPRLPGLIKNFQAQDIYGNLTENIQIIDTMPEADLCLLRIQGRGFRQVAGLTFPSLNDRFSELQNYGAPAGHFSGSDLWNIFMYEGRWSGHCTERCAIPDDRVNYNNLIVHTIPTTRGQSGSPIFINNLLFGVQMATSDYIEDFGIATSSRSIYLLLERNNINRFIGIEE